MTQQDFNQLWASRYPGTPPISHAFRHDYPERWLRIHSLPESKRYADSEDEWKILLERQNALMTDLFGDGGRILIVSGDYHREGYVELHVYSEVASMQAFSFVKLDEIELEPARPGEPGGSLFKPYFCASNWAPHQFDYVLRDIANDALRVLFVAVDHDTLIAPYDGGVDLIVKDGETRDRYKAKYKDWLSQRSDGL